MHWGIPQKYNSNDEVKKNWKGYAEHVWENCTECSDEKARRRERERDQ
jgi:hypothetical protein